MTKLLTVCRGPILAAATDIQKAETISALLIRPIGILPREPGDQIRPFAIGLFDEIRTLMKPEVTATILRRAVAAFVHSKRYYCASAQLDSMRHDIEGAPLEPLTDEDRMTAQTRFLALKLKTNGVNDKSTLSPPSIPAATPAITKSEQIRAALLGRGRSQRSRSSAS
ncbi:ProQ/FINO family protein [Rhizobium sp. ICMP 5592]|uniref:ProQ/FINO family protein n=1 Tax=Rhizobium sp. ICMP 5592 TaxID=2292445 RepID=UPI001297484E|nr:ProQ/FINO family protein [Rhizobium sp. ICMP 5592]MQB46505.1 ProQ/FINO family protein [Rhizobium sp. ICMP 5592]